MAKPRFEWDKVHSIANELAHISSEDLIIKFEQFLGHHGFVPN